MPEGSKKSKHAWLTEWKNYRPEMFALTEAQKRALKSRSKVIRASTPHPEIPDAVSRWPQVNRLDD